MQSFTRSCPHGILAAIALMMTMAGCASTGDPSVKVLGARVVDASPEGLKLSIALEVTNPGKDFIRLDEFEYRVSVDGTAIYAASWSAEATLASNDTRRMTVPAVALYSMTGWSAEQSPQNATVSINGSMSYIAPGPLANVMRDMGIPNPRASISGTSETSLAVAR